MAFILKKILKLTAILELFRLANNSKKETKIVIKEKQLTAKDILRKP